jgi:phosphohistidine phosphatase
MYDYLEGGCEMRLYLVRHGEAVQDNRDDFRVLTEEGRKEAAKVAAYLGESGAVKISKIYHSEKARSKQTAEIFASFIHPKEGLEESEELKPNDDALVWFNKIPAFQEAIMIVGHLPHIGRLASYLLCGSMEGCAVNFPPAGTICLENDTEERWSLLWFMIPEILP